MAPKAKADAGKPAAKAKADPKKKAAKKEEKAEDDEKRVPPPDSDAFKEKVNKVNEDIDKLNKEQAKYSEKINERSYGKTEFFAQKTELKSQLDELSGKIDELMGKREEINKAVGDKRQEGREMKDQINKMKRSIGYGSETEIDDRIASIEFKLWTDTISLKDEKKYLAEIQELKRNRPKVSQVNKMEEGLQTLDQGMSLKERVAVINEEMAKYREQRRGVSAKYQELMDQRKEQLGDINDIVTKKEELGKQISEKVRERNEIREEYRQQEKEYHAYQAELRKQRAERQQQEQQKWRAEQDQRRKLKEAERLDEQPHVQEMTLIEQTILFCKGLTASKGPEVKEQPKETVLDNPEGTEVLSKKTDRDEYYFVPTSKGKKGKTKAKGGKAEGSSKPIKHNAETFRLFDQLKVDAPITTDDIPDTLEKLEAQLEDYKEKVKKWEATRDEKKRKILEGAEVEEVKEEEPKEEEETKEEESKDAKEEEAEESKD